MHSEPVGALYDPNKDTLYSVKAICLISTVPIVCVAKVRSSDGFRKYVVIKNIIKMVIPIIIVVVVINLDLKINK